MCGCKDAMGTNEHVLEQLKKLRGSKTVIIGIGNILKGDDGVGPLTCLQLRGNKICAELIDAGTVPENYIQPIVRKAPQNLIVIDAIDFGAAPGTINIFEPEQLSSLVLSTHALSPHLFVDMVRKQIETTVYFVGIQPAQTRLGQSVSAQVSLAAEWLTSTLTEIFPPKKTK